MRRIIRYNVVITTVLALFIIFVGCLNDVRTIDNLKERSSLNSSRIAPVIDSNELERLVFIAVNNEREQNGFDRLRWNDRVAEVARRHSLDMAEKDYFDHVDGFGYDVDGRMRIAGLRSYVVGENIFKESVIGKTQITYRGGREVSRVNTYKDVETMVEAAVQGWMESPSHRANILNREYRISGIGVANQSDWYYITQNFAANLF